MEEGMSMDRYSSSFALAMPNDLDRAAAVMAELAAAQA